MSFQHTPVLLNEVITLFAENNVRHFIDGTIGGAGHTRALLEALPGSTVLGIDRDPEALRAAELNLAPFKGRFCLLRGEFADLERLAARVHWDEADAVLLDLGVSSHQIDSPNRGFSFRMDGPLDMRMNPDAPLTAADILNTRTEHELADIFFKYGEEHKSRQVAHAVVARRTSKPWSTTADFAALLESIVGRAGQHGLPPQTRCFQALRIAVNDELEQLKLALTAALNLLKTNGLLTVISFHSLEDRIVKQFFNYQAATCVCPPGLPICTCGKVQDRKSVV